MPIAVVTGASRGLGRHIAAALHNHGYHVALNYRYGMRGAEELASSFNGKGMAVEADVGELKQVEEIAGKVFSQWGRIDALINNAGITRDGLLMNYKEADLDEVIRVNLKGCFNTAKCFVPFMRKSGGGHIISVSSSSGSKGRAGQAAYSASKAGILGLTYGLAKELARFNIRVNAVVPGYMPTDMGIKTKKAIGRAEEESLLGRLSDPFEISEFIAYLLTTEHITGQVFSLDSRL
jgi:3-oxoacyl-[acyl-carrier protein] reductase